MVLPMWDAGIHQQPARMSPQTLLPNAEMENETGTADEKEGGSAKEVTVKRAMKPSGSGKVTSDPRRIVSGLDGEGGAAANLGAEVMTELTTREITEAKTSFQPLQLETVGEAD